MNLPDLTEGDGASPDLKSADQTTPPDKAQPKDIPPKPDVPHPKPDIASPKVDMPTPKPDLAPPPDQSPTPDSAKSCTSAKECNDNISCTQDLCVTGKCQNQVNPNFCVVQKKCITIGSINPSNVCQKCQPTKNPWDYSNYVCTLTLAGTGKAGHTDGHVSTARFYYPSGIAVGSTGEVYVADPNNHRVRMIYKNQVTTLAGSGKYGLKNGPAASAEFRYPFDVAVGPTGEVFVADNYNHCIRVIKGGQVSTLAGDGKAGMINGSVSQARFYYPMGVAAGPSGEIYVADQNNQRIRWIFNSKVYTLAGTGKAGWVDGSAAQAKFYNPYSVAAGLSGEVYVADYSTNHVRMIKGGKVTTLAGSGKYGHQDGPAMSAYFRNPSGVAAGSNGDVFVADRKSHVIRRIAGGKVTTLAGTPAKYGHASSPAAFVYFNDPLNLTFKPPSTLYVADRGNHRIRIITW